MITTEADAVKISESDVDLEHCKLWVRYHVCVVGEISI